MAHRDLFQIPTDVRKRRDTPVSRAWWERLTEYVRLRADKRVGGALRRQMGPTAISQEVLLKVNGNLSGFEASHDGGFRAWIDAILRNCIRGPSRRVGIGREAVGEGLSRMAADAPSPMEMADQREQNERVNRAFANLDPEDQQIIRLRRIEELTHAEISARLEMTPKNVRYRYERALKRLRREMQANQ